MQRGEVWWTDFNESVGGQIQKRRPAIIVSNDSSNRFLNRVQVVPVTSRTERLYPGEAYVHLQGDLRKAMANQLTTVDKARLSSRIDRLSREDVEAVARAIRVQLALS